MEKIVYIGHIKNAVCDTKMLVVAESPEDAKAKVLAKFSDGLAKHIRNRMWPSCPSRGIIDLHS